VSVAVVVPLGGSCPHRARSWSWLRGHYAEVHPDWQLIEARAPEGPWSKGAALNPTVAELEAEIVVVADADVWTDGLTLAVEQVEDGAAWAIPHLMVHRFSEAGTSAFMREEDRQTQMLDQLPYRGIPGGGVVIAPREVIHSIPLDARFTGWG